MSDCRERDVEVFTGSAGTTLGILESQRHGSDHNLGGIRDDGSAS
jgi:hypothetical protein